MRRLDLVTSSSNSVVAVGAWCALNAHEANKILECIGERLCSTQTSGVQRVALVYVVHELLLTCSKKGMPEKAKELVLVGVSRMLPKVLDTVLDPQFSPADGTPVTDFVLAVEKALEWWELLRLFSAKWFVSVEAKLRRVPAVAPTTATTGPQSSTFVTNVQRLSYFLAKYSELKARGTPADARRFLAVLAKLHSRYFPGSFEFQQWIQAEWRAVAGDGSSEDGAAAYSPGVVPSERHPLAGPGTEPTRIKMETPDHLVSGVNPGMGDSAAAPEAPSSSVLKGEEEDDVLGTFFD